ncbi:ATP11-domain-containing protein [Dothidotthia symphoricarpi CBS 119687]|uniref:ATP11-domain-containing protein n=1 Tax=Dothidotthia symphoricarpi CBS 119687 TaxID=1392245 RepID=A0A6A6ASH6_9PLEO|nr:ATP11-domain-containing protein [Dothidotthia symphoricarpi CBS 119687]KAF2134118.1 ATP11-domain-containing protein [Dothidotthia symphoricarpi CBS 119687]
MTLPLTTLRHALRQPLPNPRLLQRRWARVHAVRHLATHDAQARITAKYREKLEQRAKEQGLSDISELKDVYREKIDRLRKQAIVPGATGPLTPPPSPEPAGEGILESAAKAQKSPWPAPPPPPSPQQGRAKSTAPPGVKTLSSFLDVPKTQALPEKEIQALWRLRHAANPQSIHFSVPAHTFTQLLETAKQHPSFVLPMPREVPKEGSSSSGESETQQAAELHYLQFAHPHVDTTTLLFTSLGEFKLRGEYASPHTTVTFHQELAGSHNLVLGQGVVTEGRGVSVDEARWLVMCMQKFYVQSEEGKGRGELLSMFTKGDTNFKVERLIDEAEKIL